MRVKTILKKLNENSYKKYFIYVFKKKYKIENFEFDNKENTIKIFTLFSTSNNNLKYYLTDYKDFTITITIQFPDN